MAKTAIVNINNIVNVTVPAGTLLSIALRVYAFGNEQIAEKLSEYALPNMRCGGKNICKKCYVKASGDISKMLSIERESLPEGKAEEGIRLACFCTVFGDCEVQLEKKQK